MLTIHTSLTENYYTRPEVSCSTLKSLKQALYLTKRPDNLQHIFDYGSLVDALVTEPENIDHSTNTLHLAHGGVATFTDEDWQKACDQKRSIMKDPYLAQLFSVADSQVTATDDEFEFCYQGFTFTMPVRMKADADLPRIDTTADLKTTACTTQKAAVASISHFDYDMQGAFYMDVLRRKRFLFAFSSKKGKKEVFKHAMQRGDDLYQSGLAKYSYWAYMYYMLVYSLRTEINHNACII